MTDQRPFKCYSVAV